MLIPPRFLTRDSPSGWGGIRKAESHAEVAVTCLSCLGFRYFDGDITDGEVDGFIAKGEYALHKYSQSNFLHHIRGARRNVEGIGETLRVATKEFLKIRWNPGFRHIGSEQPPSSSALGTIPSVDREDYKKLCIIADHLRARSLTKGIIGLFFLHTKATGCSRVACRRGTGAIAFDRHLPSYRRTFRHTGLAAMPRNRT